MILLEPAVSLTDLGLAVESSIFVWMLAQNASCDTDARRNWMLFFAGLALAALSGFVSHGLLADKQSALHQWVSAGTLLAIGLAAFAAGAEAARLLFGAAARRVVQIALILLALYCIVVVMGEHRFGLAIAAYAPATLLMLAAFVLRARREPARHWWLGIGGLALTAVAAAVQQLGIGLHPEHFNHNALYHTLQAVALALLYGTAREILRAGVRG